MLLLRALTAACEDVVDELQHVPLPHWTESVFRFFLVRRLLEMSDIINCQTEWSRIDLVLCEPASTSFIELKFFASRSLERSDGSFLQWKGGPGRKNRDEFDDVIRKLSTIRTRPEGIRWGKNIDAGFVVLAYADPAYSGTRPTFGGIYDALSEGDKIRSIMTILDHVPAGNDSLITCKLIEVDLTP